MVPSLVVVIGIVTNPAIVKPRVVARQPTVALEKVVGEQVGDLVGAQALAARGVDVPADPNGDLAARGQPYGLARLVVVGELPLALVKRD